MSSELVIFEPKNVVVKGRDAAAELTKIVSSRPKKLVMSGKQYLFFEDWQTIGKFYGVTATVRHTEELREGEGLIGFLASAVAIADGVEVSGADAECTFDEPNWTNKPRFQLRSMAQTRACAKALRNCLGWVAVLAGYEATPAEEMADVKTSSDKGHWCPLHNCTFFKKGRMKGWAHKIEGTNEWCNEEDISEGSVGSIEGVEVEIESIEDNKTDTKGAGLPSGDDDKGQARQGTLDGGSETIVTPGDLFTWIRKNDPNIKVPRIWIQTNYNLTANEVMTNEKAQELCKAIKEKEKW